MSDVADADARQLSIDAVTNDRPTTGVAIDERTHYGHVRYAATETPGVIWYDSRDGRERLTLDADTSLDALGSDGRVLTAVELHGHRNVCGIVDPSERWVLEATYARTVEYEPLKLDAEPRERIETVVGSEIFEDQAAARDAAAEKCAVYADAEWRDAVTHRTAATEGDAK